MALLFVGGIMNLAWIAGIALLVLIEKTLPWGGRISRLTGAVLVAWIDPEVGVAAKLANEKNNDRPITARPRETPSRWNIISWFPF